MPSYSPHDHPAGGPWRLAGWWSRVGAALIDGIVVSAMAFVLLIVVGAIAGTGFLLGETAGFIGLIVGIMLWGLFFTVAALLYAPLMMAKTNGRRLGGMATGIRVVRANGKRDGLRLGHAARGRGQGAAVRHGCRTPSRSALLRCSTSCGRCGTRRTARSTTSSWTRA